MATVKTTCITRDASGNKVILRPGDTVPVGVTITNPDVVEQPKRSTKKES